MKKILVFIIAYIFAWTFTITSGIDVSNKQMKEIYLVITTPIVMQYELMLHRTKGV